MESYRKAVERYLPYGITECCLTVATQYRWARPP